MINLANTNDVIATGVLVTEILLFSFLLLARYNARRLKISMHHKYVYTIVIVNSIIISTWMLPHFLTLLNRTTLFGGKTNPLSVWYYFLHVTFGLIAMTLGIFICLLFLIKVIKQEMIPLPLLKRIKPIMITTFIFWTLAFCFGIMIYINKYIYKFL